MLICEAPDSLARVSQVDYATGVVRLKSGETLTKEEVDEVVRR